VITASLPIAGVMVQRVLALLVALLLCPILVAAPAVASHSPSGHADSNDGWVEDTDGDDQHSDDAADPADEQIDDGSGAIAPDPLPDVPQPGSETDDDDLEPDLDPDLPAVAVPKGKTIAGKVALVRADGKAAIPRGAPKRVRQLIAAANQIVGKPYRWGGGHARVADRGYDCSGAVSYALIRAGLLRAPRVSGRLARWGSAGAGRWIAVYANRGHVYLEVAGLRLDTSAVGDRNGRTGVRWRPVIGRRSGFSARHPVGL